MVLSKALVTTFFLVSLNYVKCASVATRVQHVKAHKGYLNGDTRDHNILGYGNLHDRSKIEGDAHEIATSFVNFLERDGFDFNDTRDVQNLASFLEALAAGDIATQSKSSRFLDLLKQGGSTLLKTGREFAQKHAKGAIKEAVRMLLTTFLQKGLPLFENAYENAMQSIPINLRITYAPMAYNLWTQLFQKFKVEMPPGFNVERFICKAMTKEQCDGVIQRIQSKNAQNARAEEQMQLRGAHIEKGDEDEDDDDEYNEKSGNGDMDVLDF
ncbi:uncharacterized protein BXIN_2167 [Babesia sp. Xinjiang]|uniref:uncharacterized protein n=1 Tax=Babesia sp. Xinjiang TaxID=462227 RepID=UPI000A235358|nr:uncharacterized protein BXIN_2167 [Babesia sp. Xinjiang]ORM40450.1 hypothetical protein BXIN_2167 [Babesia sp. Xinjiang]